MFVVSTVERREYVPETLEFLVKEKDREKTYSFSKPTLLSVVWGRLRSYKNSRHFFLDTILFWQQHVFGFLEIFSPPCDKSRSTKAVPHTTSRLEKDRPGKYDFAYVCSRFCEFCFYV